MDFTDCAVCWSFDIARISRAAECRGYTDASFEMTTEIAITRYGDFTSNLLVGMTVVQNWLVMVGRRVFRISSDWPDGGCGVDFISRSSRSWAMR